MNKKIHRNKEIDNFMENVVIYHALFAHLEGHI